TNPRPNGDDSRGKSGATRNVRTPALCRRGAGNMRELSLLASTGSKGFPSRWQPWDREAATSNPFGGRAKVLLLDDDPEQVEMLVFTLTRAGQEVLTAFEPASALRRLE